MGKNDDGNNNIVSNNEDFGISQLRIENSGGNSTTMYSAIYEIEQHAATMYNHGKYDAAAVKYTQLIEMCPYAAIYYGFRAASYMKLGYYAKGLEDASESVKINPSFIHGHCLIVECALSLHQFAKMDTSIFKLKRIDPTNEILEYQADRIRELVVNLGNEIIAKADDDYTKTLESINKCLTICPQYLDYKVRKAECLVNLGRICKAKTLAIEILREHPTNSDTHYVLGTCFRQTNLQKSVYHFEEAFRLNPCCMKSRVLYESAKSILEKKIAAHNAYKCQHFVDAHNQYCSLLSECSEDSDLKMTLLFNMAQASYNLGNLNQSLRECDSVLLIDPNHVKAIIRRGHCHMDQKDYKAAIEDFERAWAIKPSVETLNILETVHNLLGTSQNGSYVVLSVEQNASEEVMTKVYRQLIKIHHPDRHANGTHEQKKYHEMKCKEITRAYRFLMDEKCDTHTPSNNTNDTQEAKSTSTKSSAFDSNPDHHNYSKHSFQDTNWKFTGPQTSSGNPFNSSRPPWHPNVSNDEQATYKPRTTFEGSTYASGDAPFSSADCTNYYCGQYTRWNMNDEFSTCHTTFDLKNHCFQGPQVSSEGFSNCTGEYLWEEGNYDFTSSHTSGEINHNSRGRQFSSKGFRHCNRGQHAWYSNREFTGSDSYPGGTKFNFRGSQGYNYYTGKSYWFEGANQDFTGAQSPFGAYNKFDVAGYFSENENNSFNGSNPAGSYDSHKSEFPPGTYCGQTTELISSADYDNYWHELYNSDSDDNYSYKESQQCKA